MPGGEINQLNAMIGENLRKLRLERELSQGKLAELAGLSKVLLSQIERGNNNPTIQTIWKIATALQVPYTALIEAPREANRVTTRAEALAHSQSAPGSGCRIYCYYQLVGQRNFEAFGMLFAPGGGYLSPGHPAKSVEYLFVQEGALKIMLRDREYLLQTGDSLSFTASQEHEYRNEGSVDAVALCLNWYAPFSRSYG